VQEHPDVAVLRADAHRNLMAVVWVLARHADWTSLTTRPTWAVLMERTGLARSTTAAWLAWLRKRGLLGTVTPGTTLQYRRGTACGLIDDGRGNEAAEYVLALPCPEDPADGQTTRPAALSPVEETRTPSSPPVGEMSNRPTRAREGMSDSPDTVRLWSRTVTPARRREMLAAAARARMEAVTLRALTDRHLRSLLRPVWQLGGTLADALHMIDHRPDGSPWPYVGMPRYLPGWIRHRLAAWLTDGGRLRPGLQLPSRAQAELAERTIAEQAARRAEQARLAEQATADPAGHADRARALLAAASPAAKAAMRNRPRPRPIPPGSDENPQTGTLLYFVNPGATETRDSHAHAQQGTRPRHADRAPAAGTGGGAATPARRFHAATEPEEIFRREVIDRHATPSAGRRWWTEPEPEHPAVDDPAALEAERQWLIRMMAAREDGRSKR
jgi:hypothetical protein